MVHNICAKMLLFWRGDIKIPCRTNYCPSISVPRVLEYSVRPAIVSGPRVLCRTSNLDNNNDYNFYF